MFDSELQRYFLFFIMKFFLLPFVVVSFWTKVWFHHLISEMFSSRTDLSHEYLIVNWSIDSMLTSMETFSVWSPFTSWLTKKISLACSSFFSHLIILAFKEKSKIWTICNAVKKDQWSGDFFHINLNQENLLKTSNLIWNCKFHQFALIAICW